MQRYLIIILLFSVFFLYGIAFGEDINKKTKPKITIAVMAFQSNNCSPSTGKAVTEMIAGGLYDIDFFILLERSQMELVIKEQGMQEEGCNDSECASKMGKVLSVQKMIVGSVNKVGNYKVIVRVVNVADGMVDKSITRNISNESDLDVIIPEIVDTIENHYLGYNDITGRFDLSFTGTGHYVLGDFSQGARNGYGCNINFTLNKIPNNYFSILFSTGIYKFNSEIASIGSILMIPIEAFLGYPFDLTKNVKLIPMFGGGYILSRVTYDKVRERTYGSYNFSSDYYYNPVLSFIAEADIKIVHRWYLVLSPSSSVFFENKKTSYFISFSSGIKLLF